MQRDETMALLKRHHQAFHQREPRALAEHYTDDAVIESPMFPDVRGRSAIERSFMSLFDIFPDWAMTFEEPVVDGDRVAQYCKVRATQVGAFMGMAGTGRRSEFTCVLAFDLRDGLIARERRIYDFTGLLIQLGILKGKPAI
jgi:steroid delta-isomerase-like uncharacterized protein